MSQQFPFQSIKSECVKKSSSILMYKIIESIKNINFHFIVKLSFDNIHSCSENWKINKYKYNCTTTSKTTDT